MPDYIGDILVPTITPSGTFPLVPDFGHGLAIATEVIAHQFGSADAKIEQRFLLGSGAKRFTVRKAFLNETDRIALRDFWENSYGPYGAFTYNAPNDDGLGTTAYTVCFANEPLSWEHLSDQISSLGVTLIEIPASDPSYAITAVQTRFPSGGLPAALLSQVQKLIPLVKIVPCESGYPAIWLSDRRVTLTGGPAGEAGTFLPRLLSFDGISQVLGNESDQAQFTFGNADRVMRDLANDTDLMRASIEFSLFWVDPATGNSGIKIDLWKGEIVDWGLDSGPEFRVTATDGIYELNLPYPTRRISRTCWKQFDDGNGCPFTASHGTMLNPHNGQTITGALAGVVNTSGTAVSWVSGDTFPTWFDGLLIRINGVDYGVASVTSSTALVLTASAGTQSGVAYSTAFAAFCDKGYETPNGCLVHGMKVYFGGILAEPQSVSVKLRDPKTRITSTSIVNESIYEQVLPEIYTDNRLPMKALIAAGRDEGEFYRALGIVGEGPLGKYGGEIYDYVTDSQVKPSHTLDGQEWHGSPNHAVGLREVLGTDPAGAAEWFSVSEAGSPAGIEAWRVASSGGRYYKDNFAAGVAFLEFLRDDPKNLQPSWPSDHEMIAIVAEGLKGWVWTATLTRTWVVLTNPIWIIVNMMLRARGLRYANAATAEQYFDLTAALAAATTCAATVTPYLVRTKQVRVFDENNNWYYEEQTITSETQFKFVGVLQEEKPLRDWIQEILMNCLGYYSFAFGKLKLGIRENSSVVEAFTVGNILFASLALAPLKPSFNHVTANFADEEFDFAANSVSIYDVDHAKQIGGATSPLFLKSTLNLSGAANKSQAGRIVRTRLSEELGGISAAEWKAAREISFKTTVLALNTEPGMVCSMTHSDMPGGAGEFRVTGWKLNPDYSIEIQGRTTTDGMYDMVQGPKPADVRADPTPLFAGQGLTVAPVTGISLSEGPVFSSDGHVLSRITASYSKPSPIGDWDHVEIWLQFETATPGTFENAVMWFATRETSFKIDLDTTGLEVRVRFVSINKDGSRPDPAAEPYADVLLDGQVSAPTTPSSVTAQSSVATGQNIIVSWDENDEADIDHYEIARRFDATAPGNTDVIAPNVPAAGASATQKAQYIDSPTVNAAQARYYVRAVNTSGYKSAFSTAALVTTLAPDGTIDTGVPVVSFADQTYFLGNFYEAVSFGIGQFLSIGQFALGYEYGTPYAQSANMQGVYEIRIRVEHYAASAGGTATVSDYTSSFHPIQAGFVVKAMELSSRFVGKVDIYCTNYFGESAAYNLFTYGTRDPVYSRSGEVKPPAAEFDPVVQHYGFTKLTAKTGGNAEYRATDAGAIHDFDKIVNVATGFQIATAAPAGQYLRGDGGSPAKAVFSAIPAGDLPDAGAAAAGKVTTAAQTLAGFKTFQDGMAVKFYSGASFPTLSQNEIGVWYDGSQYWLVTLNGANQWKMEWTQVI